MGAHLRERFRKPGPKRILALDGGGVRGLLTIGMLARLEEHLRQRSGNPNYRLCDYFDLIGGTSTGSIIATGLALGMSVAEISALYKTVIPKVFRKFWFQGVGVFAPMFLSAPLANALKEEFAGRTLASEDLRCGLAVLCKRIDTGSAWILVNNAEWAYYLENSGFRLRDVVQASAAAPHYFKGVLLNMPVRGDADRSISAFVIDGGVAGYNNPALELSIAATDHAYGFDWKPGKDQLYVLSLGTGFLRERVDALHYRRKTFVGQTLNALRSMIHDVSLQQIATLQAMSETQARWFINSEKKDQPTAPYLAPEPLLHFQRYDARIEAIDPADRRPEHAQRLIGRELDKRELKHLAEITNSNDANLSLLYEIGDEAGQHFLRVAPPPAKFDPW
ncbi:MAG TPA: patatin-like phospholipase family protein [Terricaulis sp.]|nr:patatin-like phospholipase family protein [Terricaulis sp.]HRP10698.1 patatin-like phospholipase family protein [Terricaulis sp.]